MRHCLIGGPLAAGVLLCLLAAACGGSPTEPTPPPPGPIDPPPPPPDPPPSPRLALTRFLAFGDSMTEGTTSPALPSVLTPGKTESYPYKLLDRLTARYAAQTLIVLNGGRAGELAREGINRLPDVMREAEPQVLLLVEGVNDLNTFGAAGIGPAISALEDMVKYARARNVRVFVATLPPQRPGGSRARSVEIVPRFNDEIRKMSVEERATLVDVHDAFDLSLIGQDGLHPTEAGYGRLAEMFFDAVRNAFEQPAIHSRPSAAPSSPIAPGSAH